MRRRLANLIRWSMFVPHLVARQSASLSVPILGREKNLAAFERSACAAGDKVVAFIALNLG